ncbi:hypothetical protein [Roseivirga sp. UBA1976]|uniref:hypothetical protein n=1 Tax=Roseivirga sp. UBA1976 TaxID=1947386 RepID=UPI00257DF5EE|nr:hypothetical protein [Roseivirga sp. UBA1976]|tara:strand:- start:2165 stop:5140 length:2976 start_codon:yes stop_codon:yes gene_type:complete
MKAFITSCLWLLATLGIAQDLQVPTLESKGINGKVKAIEWHTYQFVNDKGLTYVKKDVESYDESGRLATISSHLIANNQTYKYVYTVDKKGLLTEIKVVNPANNLALQTTSYEYKKSLVTKTTQVQGPNTVERNYTYNKDNHLIAVEVIQNGTQQLTEYYEVDQEGRRTKLSRKLPNQAEVEVISTYTYETDNDRLITREKRNTDQGVFEITKYTDKPLNRDVREETKKVSTAQQGFKRQLFEDDSLGNWIKGEVIDDQFGRSALILRKIIYADGSETGRTQMESPLDDRGQFMRKYSQMQLVVNGRVVSQGYVHDIPNSKDRLTYVASEKAWYLLKDYDATSNMTSWGEAQIITNTPKAILYSEGSSGAIELYKEGKKLTSGTSTFTDYTKYEVGSSAIAYLRADINKSLVVKHANKLGGKVGVAELLDTHYYWGKATDSTYVLTGYGRSISVERQLEDSNGHKLVFDQVGSGFYWYYLPDFRKNFDNGQKGDVFPAVYLSKPIEEIKENNLLSIDFSNFLFDKLANGNYRIKTWKGDVVTNISSKPVKTPDNELIVYYPLTQQYLRMDGYYALENGKEHLNRKITPLLEGSPYGYYLYNEGKSIVFYKPGVRFTSYQFNSHKLDNNKRKYGALLYDSLTNASYSMNYDLEQPEVMGPMSRLPYTQGNVYLLKLEASRWVIFEKGAKVSDYDFSVLTEDDKEVVHFYKDEKNKVQAYRFPDFDTAEPGQFIYAYNLGADEVRKQLTELSIDPDLTPKSDEAELGNLRFSKSDGQFYMTNANGIYIQSRLGWFDSFGTAHLITYDTVDHFLYRLEDYQLSETIEKGKVEVLISNEQNGVIRWGKNKALLAIAGQLQTDVNREYITVNGQDPVWKELIYDQSSGETYKFEYKNDSTFKILPIEKLPKNADAAYLIKVSDNSFDLVVKGDRIKDDGARSYNHNGDILRFFTPPGGKLSAYRFKGFSNAGYLDVIAAEIIPSAEVNVLLQQVGN